MVSSRLVVPFHPAVPRDMFDRFLTTSRRTYTNASLNPKKKTPNSSMSEDKDNLIWRVSMHGLEKEDVKATTLRSALAFCSSDLVLRFTAAFWLCVLLIEDSSCVLPREDSASFKTWLRFVSDLVAFCLEDFLHFVSRPPAFCLKTWMHFVSRPPAFYIQCAGSDTRLPMLDRTDFASWQQRIRLYCRGKENSVNILKSIDKGPYQMGTVREPLAEGTEGAPHLGPKRPRVYSDLSLKEKDQDVTDAGSREQSSFGRRADAEDCDAFDFDVDESPSAQTMFMANLSSTDPVTDEARPSYDSDILSEVQDHDHYQEAVCTRHEEYTMHDNAQLNHDVDSHTEHTSDSDMISYDQYIKDNAVSVVHSDASSVPNDAFMMLCNDMYEPHT
uniref:Integrase, catalytic region, zinc finger, CCHC-type, peptidase aspartic, catalytic n=1 Tax=Tanacetum cinerariifolium TaxID=118510 RepID=A0A699HZ35_TANCI|nr:integrase, catalytic region, zinc finger, CCHC-type, peptidase aspartic, catalytic [Tanacetum cinerariifolium]